VLTPESLAAWMARLQGAAAFAFDFALSTPEYMRAEIVGIALALEPNVAAYIPLQHNDPGTAAQLLYTLYAQNLKPEAARELERNLWFHFEGPRRDVPALGDPAWATAGIEARRLRPRPGIYSLTWVMALRERDVYRVF
jgi:hypothetical protein